MAARMPLFAFLKMSESAFSVLAKTSYCQTHLMKIINTIKRQTLKESKFDVNGRAVNKGIQRAIKKTDSSMEFFRAKTTSIPPESKSVSLGRMSNMTKRMAANWTANTVLSSVKYFFII